MTRIMAFDPGRTTGVAFLHDNGGINTYELRQVIIGDKDLTHEFIFNDTAIARPHEIVYERFQYQRRPNVDLYPVEVIGVLKMYTQKLDIPIKEQTPAQAKNLWTDSKLKTLGLWEPSQPHAMDALRHLLYYMTVWKEDRTWINLLKPQ